MGGYNRSIDRITFIRFVLVVVLMGVSLGGGIYFNSVLHVDIVYTHFMYIPIALACTWWGLRGTVVAFLLGGVVFSFHLFGFGVGNIWNDLARILFFIVVGVFIGSLRDKALATQAALHQSEERYRLLIEKSFSGTIVCREGIIEFANDRFCEMLGYPPGDLVGRSLEGLAHPGDRASVLGMIAGSGGEDAYRLLRRDGTVVWVEAIGGTVAFDGLQAALVNVYDITERKQAEEKQRELAELARRQQEQLEHSTRLAELGEMAAAISHELNQPLTGIRNYARNAFYMIDKKIGTDDEVKGNLRLISDQVDRASRIINQMRELTRRSERQLAPQDVNAIVRESVEFLMPQMVLSQVSVNLELSDGLPPVLGERIRLAQVFLNILTNARQAMEESRERRLSIRSRLREGAVEVEVSDTGKGFSAEQARNLFVPFFTTKKSGHGTGLGLSISKSIIKDHSGAIEAHGEPGRGATFTVHLPAYRKAPG